MTPDLSPEILAYYTAHDEANRLTNSWGQLEFVRTQEIVERYLPSSAVIYDVGGGSGPYSCWLAQKGYEVHLIEPVPLLLAQARQNSARQPATPIASLTSGDARALPRENASADVVLLFGPLYHLLERKQRIQALQEAQRVLRIGGVVFAAGISRFASALDGMVQGFAADPAFRAIVATDLAAGTHVNQTDNLSYFTTAYLHRPEELKAEIEAVGLQHQATLPIEGPAWLLQNLPEQWEDPSRREMLLQTVRWLESEPSLIGASAHLMVIGLKQ